MKKKVIFAVALGDPDTSKTAASWFDACIFLILAATFYLSTIFRNRQDGVVWA